MDDSIAYCAFLPKEKTPTLREQEIQFIKENGLEAFCHALMLTALLTDPEYLRAQIIFLNKS